MYAVRSFRYSARMQLRQVLEFRDAALSRAFGGKGRIPMATFVERYIDGSVAVAGDLHEFIRSRDEWANYRFTWEQAQFLITRFIPSLLVHSKAADQKFVVGHYDRGNDFFEAFLGPSMVYTSAVFGDEDEPLEDAQARKIRRVAERLQVRRGDRLLDIGCGWGTLALTMAEEHGADATGVTLSSKQAEFATARIRERNLGDRARILAIDYRDIPVTRFDKISCLEMAEHVGVKNFQKFLRQVSDLLEDDGLFFLQIVGLRRPPEALVVRNDRGGYWNAADFTWAMFMSKYIFPGADASLPLSFVSSQMEKAGLEIRSMDNINVHYGITIHRWYKNWQRNREKVIAAYGDRWYRLWELFLAWSVFTGTQGRADCMQIVAHKSRPAFDRTRFVGEPQVPQPLLQRAAKTG
jgi:cyclopropane fatty-acyl-phospholipid synthase-like methyltransferase